MKRILWKNAQSVILYFNHKHMKQEFLHEELKRVSEWVRFADSKMTVVAGFYAWAIWWVLSVKDKIPTIECWSIVLIMLFWLWVVVGIIFLSKSLFPTISSKISSESCFYFGSVSKMKFIQFSKKFSKMTEKDICEQLSEQIFTNSEIADYKMKNIRCAIIALYPSLFLALILVLFANK